MCIAERGSKRPPGFPAPSGFFLQFLGVLFDVVSRPNRNRAERDEVSVGGAAIVYRHSEEPGGPECFAVRRSLLEVPAERFLTLVDAGDDLKARSARRWRRRVERQSIQRLFPEPLL